MDRQSPDRAIRQVECAYDRAWGDGNIDAIVECFTDDAIVVNPRGDVAHGRGEIRSLIAGFLAGEASGSQHESSLLRVVLVTENVAVVDGEASIAAQSTRDGVTPVSIRHGFTDILVAHGGRWRIAHVRAYQLPHV